LPDIKNNNATHVFHSTNAQHSSAIASLPLSFDLPLAYWR